MRHRLRDTGRFLAVTALVVLAAPTATASPATAAPADTTPLDGAVRAAIWQRSATTPEQAASAGREARVGVRRRAGEWAFGTALLTAPPRPDAYPAGWMFLAHHGNHGWQVALDSSDAFLSLAGQAPATVLSARERDVFTANLTASAANSTYNTGLRLPYGLGQSWTLAGGPHGWGGSETPYSSVDLSGGDGRVLAAGGGNVYVMCTSVMSGQFGGWLRVYHPNGYTTDYYHLWNVITPSGGSWVSEGAFLGNTGMNLCAGGSANGPHVHFSILIGTTRVDWNWREVGKWVLWDGGSAYGGYALHGSAQVNVGGTLYNYGTLGANQGIVDAWDSGYVNKRSGPGTGYAIVSSAADGTTITISCWNYGTTHTGRYGTTSVWDKLTDGTWISDAFVYTGTNTIGPQC